MRTGTVTTKAASRHPGVDRRALNLPARAFRRFPVCRAFTLIELMVAIALMAVIVLGLMAMFNQTQRAFRLGLAQTDILESGRMASDLMAGEMEQMTPSGLSFTWPDYAVPNFIVQPVEFSYQSLMPGGTPRRTNFLDDVLFLARENQTWKAIGYFVRPNRDVSGDVGPVGTLYRFETNTTLAGLNQLVQIEFNHRRNGTNVDNVSKILDGVVEFKVQPYDSEGWSIPDNPTWYTNAPSMWSTGNLQMYATNGLPPGFPPALLFYSNAVPAFVQVDLGILEHQTYEQYKSIPNAAAQKSFLQNHAGQVHLFRQRIAIRNVDPMAYLPTNSPAFR